MANPSPRQIDNSGALLAPGPTTAKAAHIGGYLRATAFQPDPATACETEPGCMIIHDRRRRERPHLPR
jgi:hypothetical protein